LGENFSSVPHTIYVKDYVKEVNYTLYASKDEIMILSDTNFSNGDGIIYKGGDAVKVVGEYYDEKGNLVLYQVVYDGKMKDGTKVHNEGYVQVKYLIKSFTPTPTATPFIEDIYIKDKNRILGDRTDFIFYSNEWFTKVSSEVPIIEFHNTINILTNSPSNLYTVNIMANPLALEGIYKEPTREEQEKYDAEWASLTNVLNAIKLVYVDDAITSFDFTIFKNTVGNYGIIDVYYNGTMFIADGNNYKIKNGLHFNSHMSVNFYTPSGEYINAFIGSEKRYKLADMYNLASYNGEQMIDKILIEKLGIDKYNSELNKGNISLETIYIGVTRAEILEHKDEWKLGVSPLTSP